MLSKNEKKAISILQKDIPITDRPYLKIAKKLDISEQELLRILSSFEQNGLMRRFGATIRHQKSGYTSNAMIAWQVSEDRIHEVGRVMAESSYISHCYRRNPTNDWPYNLYTMVHAGNENECYRIAQSLSDNSNIDNYSILFSRKEFKKTSMIYFSEEDE